MLHTIEFIIVEYYIMIKFNFIKVLNNIKDEGTTTSMIV